MHRRLTVAACLIALLGSVPPVRADLVIPSVAKMIAMPGPMSLAIITLVITLPLTLIAGWVEACVVRRYLPNRGKHELVLYLTGINLVTSFVGIFTMPNGTELWPGLPLAYLATTAIEVLFLLVLFEPSKRRPMAALIASARMNAASYALFGTLLLTANYYPALLMHGSVPASELSGHILLSSAGYRTDDSYALLDLEADPITVKTGTMHGEEDQTPRLKVASIDGARYVVDTRTHRRVRRIWSVHPFTGPWALSHDGGCYASGNYNGRVIVGDVKTSRERAFEGIDSYVFSHAGALIALLAGEATIVYDPMTGGCRRMSAPWIVRGSIVWSPDDRYLAYLADLTPFTHDIGNSFADSVRVIRLSDGKSTTIAGPDPRLNMWSMDWRPGKQLTNGRH